MAKEVEGNCTICTQYFSLLHYHHTVPRALGGEDSLQIPLCAQCHNVLHAEAEAIVAKKRTGKEISRTYWTSPLHADNARPFLEILVNAMLNADLAPIENKLWIIQARAPDALRRAMQLYKLDSGLPSMEKALLLCLAETLKKKGYLNGNDKSQSHSGQEKPKKPAAPLW